MVIQELTKKKRDEWDAFVKNAPGGLPQHLSGWQDVLEKTYRYKTHYLLAVDEVRDSRLSQEGGCTSVVGALPLFLISSLLRGRTLTTLPGGLCARDDEVAAELIAQGEQIARQVKADRFVVHDSRRILPGALKTEQEHENWLIDLRPGEESLWKGLHRNIRRQVRIARRNELTVEVDRVGNRLGDFYEIMSRFTHQAGTPIFARAFLENVIETFPNGFNIVLVSKEEQPIGGYFQLELGNTVYGTWGATLHEYLELRPVYLAYWEIMAHALARGFDYLDMGRSSKGSNASKYKSQWGGESAPVYQQVSTLGKLTESANGATSIASEVNEDAKFQLFREWWPKMPFPVAQFIGPKLRRHVPFA